MIAYATSFWTFKSPVASVWTNNGTKSDDITAWIWPWEPAKIFEMAHAVSFCILIFECFSSTINAGKAFESTTNYENEIDNKTQNKLIEAEIIKIFKILNEKMIWVMRNFISQSYSSL